MAFIFSFIRSPWSFGILIFLSACLLLRPSKRRRAVDATSERVLIIGGTSGIGLEIARQYVLRKARVVCVVGRRKNKVDAAVGELENIAGNTRIIGIQADASNEGDMVRVRTLIEQEASGLDTLLVCAGVSSTKPLLQIADISTKDGITRVVQVAQAALQSNYIGPLVAAVTFIPILSSTSPSPSILLLSSLASVIPAPTRSLYGSTKAAGHVLYQSLAIEHPNIRFCLVCPRTVEGGFREGAVDGYDVSATERDEKKLPIPLVASACLSAVDNKTTGTVFIPQTMRYAHLLYWIWPSFVERKAAKKYGFSSR